MRLETWKDPASLTRYVRVEITDNDLITVYGRLDGMDRHCLSEWNRPDASMEERFMVLQLIARKLEEAENERES